MLVVTEAIQALVLVVAEVLFTVALVAAEAVVVLDYAVLKYLQQVLEVLQFITIRPILVL